MERNVTPENFEAPQEHYPFPAPFILSSVEREWCRFQANRTAAIIFIKRRHLEENLKTFAKEIGMNEAEQKNFLDWWCCAKGEEIRAEGDPYFNLRYRAESWMEKRRPQSKSQQQSRLEQYAESARQAFGVSPGDKEPGVFGYAVLPDEQ
jgi:hypothetical protein